MSKRSEETPLVVGTYVTNDNAEMVAVTGVPIYADAQCGTRFVNQGYRDLWAAALWVAAFAAVSLRAVYGFAQGQITVEERKSEGGVSGSDLVAYTAVSGLITLLGNVLAMGVMHVAPAAYITMSNVIVILLNFAVGVLCFTKLNSTYGGIVFVLVGLIHLWWFYLAQRRIPLAALLLRWSTEIAFKYSATLYVSMYSVLLNYLNAFVTIATILTFVTYSSDKGITLNGTNSYLALIGVLLVFYWTNQVIMNVVHVTISGVGATVYFMNAHMPSNPTWHSFRRAMTTSFGSICFGSLVVAILQLLHALCRAAASNRRSFIAVCALCLVSCLERLVQFFNKYAFTYVAIYGDNFIEAAKKAWNLITTATCATIFNDNLIYSAIYVTILFWTVATGAIVYVIYRNVAVAVSCAIWAFVISVVVLRVVYVSVITMFVCVAEEPDALRETNPTLHGEIMAAISAANSSSV